MNSVTTKFRRLFKMNICKECKADLDEGGHFVRCSILAEEREKQRKNKQKETETIKTPVVDSKDKISPK